jgi:hypothetical protein
MPASGIGQTLPRVTDPIFGLAYDPAKITFEDAADVVARCAELTNARWSRRAWLYARNVGSSGTYLVLGGLYERRESPAKGEKRFESDPKGVFLREREGRCDLIGPAREVFEYPLDGVTPETLQALARDAARRYADAFSGKQKFLSALARGKKQADLDNPRSSILREAVEELAR